MNEASTLTPRLEEEYEVETILDAKVIRRKFKYLVKWKGYPDSENSWEPLDNIKNASKAIAQFHQKHPGAPRPIAASLFLAMNFRPINAEFDAPLAETLRLMPNWEDGITERPTFRRKGL